MKSAASRQANPRLLVGLAVGLVAVGSYVMVWQPQADRLAEAGERQARAERELLLAGPSLTTPTAAVAEAAARLTAAVPPTPNLPDLLRRLEDVASASGMANTTISPGTPTLGPSGLTTVSLSITANGRRAAAREYVRLLATLDRVLVVDQVSLQGAAATGAVGEADGDAEVQLHATVRAFASGA